MTNALPTIEQRRLKIGEYLRAFRCAINRYKANHSGPASADQNAFLLMVREYGWIIGHRDASLRQIFLCLRYVQEIADLTGQADPGPQDRRLSPSLRRFIAQRDEYTCRYCGREGSLFHDPDRSPWHVDHVIPVSRGGLDAPDNLVLSCAACNIEKGTMTGEEYERSR